MHASWLNQVEIYLSVLQRKAIAPADFADLDALATRILSFETATTPPPARSTGGPPGPISTITLHGGVATTRMRPVRNPSRPPDPRRTNAGAH
ncbi:hypothetical protein GCM10023094_33900 [Rhodococcus olei]|uniref:Uncharacterized protein n=1 Tax=Rhodococcus olei TaxID=2161675 RepID=A0ABP8PA18_9NOCA